MIDINLWCMKDASTRTHSVVFVDQVPSYIKTTYLYEIPSVYL